MKVVKIYESGKQVAQEPLLELIDDGWTIEEFENLQRSHGRECIIEESEVSAYVSDT